MLKNFRKSEKGFTLIELLIVVAIIGILAAIAIPQFAAYRIRAFNGASNADVKNARTAQEALFADFQTYGESQSDILLAAGSLDNAPGAGAVAFGPMPAATTTVSGCALAGPRNSDAAPVGVGTGLSNGVVFISSTAAAVGGSQQGSPSFIMGTKHTQGNRVFAAETEGTAIFFVENPIWAGYTLDDAADGPTTAYTLLSAVPTVGAEVSDTVAAGGTPVANWTAQ